MSKKFYKRDEQIKLIMECRQSGLSDYQWCSQNEINPGSFYNWVSKLHKIGYTFPESRSKSSGAPNIQEMVKVNLVEQEISSTIVEQNASTLPMQEKSTPTAELIIDNTPKLSAYAKKRVSTLFPKNIICTTKHLQ